MKKISKENKVALEDESKTKKLVRDALVLGGDIIPSSEDDVLLAESSDGFADIELPSSLDDPNQVLNKGRLRFENGERLVFSRDAFSVSVDAVARAAREGGQISPEVEEKMKSSRKRVDSVWGDQDHNE